MSYTFPYNSNTNNCIYIHITNSILLLLLLIIIIMIVVYKSIVGCDKKPVPSQRSQDLQA